MTNRVEDEIMMKSFIETQFPVSKISKESYKERMANYSQTLTGLGKWWGRKPLVLVRATILGLLLPSSDDAAKDREIFLKLMTMDDDGLWLRYVKAKKPLSAADVVRVLTDEEHAKRVERKIKGFTQDLPQLTHGIRQTILEFIDEKAGNYRWKKGIDSRHRQMLEQLAFSSMYYDERLEYTLRPEQVDGPSPESWTEINAHLNTKASSLPELIAELGMRRFGHRPRVGDAFCGGGSIPFEAARLGCDVYASDLNPVAALLTWAAIHVVGGGPEVAEAVKAAQKDVYESVDRQITEWGIEHNEWGHRADAYLYCVEVVDPETGWRVPLAPSWVIGEKTRTVAILHPIAKEKRYDIEIKMNADAAEMAAAKKGTVEKGYVVHPMNENKVPMSTIRREGQGGLRPWTNDDVVPRPDDVFQERLYCIRYVVPSFSERLDALLGMASAQPDTNYYLWQIDGEWAHQLKKKLRSGVTIAISGRALLAGRNRQHEEDYGKILYSTLRQPDQIIEKDGSLHFRAQFNLLRCEIVGKTHGDEFLISEVTIASDGATLFAVERPKKKTEPPADLFGSTESVYLDPPDTASRYYTAPTEQDKGREARVLHLLQERFADWQANGFIPSRKIEGGYNTDQPIRERGWTHWHHLFNPRQLLVNGLFMASNVNGPDQIGLLLSTGKCLDYNARLASWTPAAGSEKSDHVFANQALNTLSNYGTRSAYSSEDNFRFSYKSYFCQFADVQMEMVDARSISHTSDFWITDPPYADAVNYHELSEFFLAWYEKHIPRLFPDWVADSRRSLAIKGADEDFRRSMIEAYRNLADHMPDEGMQVVMFTHQDAGVWADLTLILWAAGLRVTAAWTIATETTSALKEGNYVQGTVLLVLRKNTSNETAFVDQLVPDIEEEVRQQIDSMQRIEDKEEPNFADTDYQLAAYAAALRVLTTYRRMGDINVEAEIARGAKSKDGPLIKVIENAKDVATSYLIPEGISRQLWNDLSGPERFYLKALDMESKGANQVGAYQELARGFGLQAYKELMGSLSANSARPKTASEFAASLLEEKGEGFEASMVRRILYAVYRMEEGPNAGREYLKLQAEYGRRRRSMVEVLRYLQRFVHSIPQWSTDATRAGILGGLIENDPG